MRKRSRNCSAQLIFYICLFHYLLLILESDKDYNKTSQIEDIFPITLRLSPKLNFGANFGSVLILEGGAN